MIIPCTLRRSVDEADAHAAWSTRRLASCLAGHDWQEQDSPREGSDDSSFDVLAGSTELRPQPRVGSHFAAREETRSVYRLADYVNLMDGA